MPSILIAEDEPALLELLSEVLEEAGYEVAAARDGVEALEQLERRPFDLLLTDIRMPRVDGLELLARIRAIRDSVGHVFRELLLNAIEWGGRLDPSRKVRISYLRARRMLLYRIADPGPGFRFEGLGHAAIANPPDRPVNHALVREEQGLRPGGLGLLIAQSMADELLYNEAHNEVVFVKYLG